MDRFKGLGASPFRVTEESWTDVHTIVQQVVKKHSKGRGKCKKAKRLSEEALQIAEKRRAVKSRGIKEGYTYLNAEYQRETRRVKKGFLRKQRKEIEENNRMRNSRDLFKKIRDTQGNISSKNGHNKGKKQY